jgi:membrane carboxypeptidase/penicillin-binding protein
LVWSAQSKTLNPTSLEKFSSEFAQVVLERMLEEGVIRKQ